MNVFLKGVGVHLHNKEPSDVSKRGFRVLGSQSCFYNAFGKKVKSGGTHLNRSDVVNLVSELVTTNLPSKRRNEITKELRGIFKNTPGFEISPLHIACGCQGSLTIKNTRSNRNLYFYWHFDGWAAGLTVKYGRDIVYGLTFGGESYSDTAQFPGALSGQVMSVLS